MTVPVEIVNNPNPGIASFGFEINYDDNLLTLNSIEAGALISDRVEYFMPNVGKNRCLWVTTDGPVAGDGVLMEFKFRVKSTAKASEAPVNITLINGKEEGEDNLSDGEKSIFATFQGGVVNILGGRLGDLTGDGKLTPTDAITLLQALLDRIVLDQRQERLAKVRGKSSYALPDAIRILMIYLDREPDPGPEPRAAKGAMVERETSQSAVKISVDSGSVSKGGTVSLPVRISGNSGFGSYAFGLNIPNGYKLDPNNPVTDGVLTTGVTKPKDGILNVGWISTQLEAVTGDGILFYLNLIAEQDASTSEVSVKLWKDDKEAFCDVDGNAIDVDFESGTLTVEDSSDPAADISNATVEDIPAQTYTGQEIRPAVTVKDGGTTLEVGTDYTLEYSDNVDVGTA